MAAATLWHGSGGQFDLCHVVLRPCTRCACGCAEWYPRPFIRDGQWTNDLNCARCRDWCCGVEEVILPSTAYSVALVNVNGVVLDPSVYRLDNYRRLVRTDGNAWPHCQDMHAAEGGPNTFTVRYTQSRLEADGLRAYGRLAGEILASWVDPGSCRLPEGITSVTREGVTIDFEVLAELANRTGIVEVDRWLRLVNPSGQPNARSLVISPDTLFRPQNRTTTWGV